MVSRSPSRSLEPKSKGTSQDASPGKKDFPLRNLALLAHRYVGLATAVFLAMAGLTGTLLAFYHELDVMLNPKLLRAEAPSPGAVPLDPLVLRERVESHLPQVQVNDLYLKQEPGQAASLWVSTREGQSFEDDEVLVHPYTGEILGTRHWGDITQGKKTLMSFIYRLHYTLALDTVGMTLMGIIALLWTLDCFVGAYLTFPVKRGEGNAGTGTTSGSAKVNKSWFARWKPAWLLRATGTFSFMFTWHRASGLWVWAMLLIFAWSSVGLNLKEIYNPVMKALFGVEQRARETLAPLDKPLVEPKLSWPEAREIARIRMDEEAQRRNIEIFNERAMSYDASRGVYRYQVRSSRDISERYPATTVWIDGNTGALRAFEVPTGEKAGNTITTWIYHLHWGTIAIGGLPYRIFVAVMGVAVAGLSVTGVWIWWKKRSFRIVRRNRKQN